MADSPAHDVAAALTIQSHTGPYSVRFDAEALDRLDAGDHVRRHFVVDRRVAELHRHRLKRVLALRATLVVEAAEEAKSLERFPAYVEALMEQGLKRNHSLTAIGGGIVQDIVCFLAAVTLRGLGWTFYPTTLLAQADSCIGSKSSINVGRLKNILGTFTPPRQVFIDDTVLGTLDERDIRSGIGEMLKVHAIAGPGEFDRIAGDYPRLLSDGGVRQHYIRRSLDIKKGIIEQDEFDRGIRNVMNYGHTFGHAIESATDFAIPHGIAVTIGMDMANTVAVALEAGREIDRERMHPVLSANYRGFERTVVPLEPFLAAISKDKKNVGDQVTAILPDHDGRIRRTTVPNDLVFRDVCRRYLEHGRAE